MQMVTNVCTVEKKILNYENKGEEDMYLDEIDIKATKEEMIHRLNFLSLFKKEELLDYLSYSSSIIPIPEKDKVPSSMDKKYLNAMEKKDRKAYEIHVLFNGINSLESPYKEILQSKYIYKKSSSKICKELNISERTFWRMLDKSYLILAIKLDLEVLKR